MKNGNCLTFARLYCEAYPEIAVKKGYKSSEYRSCVEFNKNEAEDLFTIWDKDYNKDFFDIKMNYRGTKEY